MKSLNVFVCVFLLLAPWMVGCKAESTKSSKSKPGSDAAGETTNTEQEEASSEGGGVGQWASDQWNRARSTGTGAVDNTGEWISKLYKSAKDAGTTTASSTAEWVSEDWNSRGDWEYQILQLPSADLVQVQNQLNEAGKSRWECYHVDTAGTQWTFFMKRSKYSYLSKVPLRDLTNFIPMGGEGN